MAGGTYGAGIASKRLHLSNPMCSVSGTWGIRIWEQNIGFEDAVHKAIGNFPRAGKYASPLLCGIFEADLPLRSYTPRSASLHVGLLRCGLFEAKMLQTLAKERSTTFHMYPDSDTPGELLFMQLHDVLPSLTRHQLPPKCKDFAKYYVRVKNEE